MLSSRFYKILEKLTETSHYMCAVPLTWDKFHLLFHVDPKIYGKTGINFSLYVFWLLAMVISILRIYQEKDLESLNLAISFTFCGLQLMLMFSVGYLYPEDYCRTLNGTLQFLRYIHSNFMPMHHPDHCKLNKVVDLVTILIIIFLFSIGIFLLPFVIAQPRAATFVGKLIPEEYFYWPCHTFVIIFHIYCIYLALSSAAMLCILILTYGVYCTIILTRDLRLRRNSATYRSEDSLRLPKNIIKAYRSLQVLTAHAMELFGIYLVVGNATFMVAAVYLNFILISYSDKLDAFFMITMSLVDFNTILGWTFVLELGSYLYSQGSKVLRSWSGECSTEWKTKNMKKFQRSCRPILISYGTQYVLKRTSLFNFYRSVVRGTCRALLMTK